MGFAPLSTAQKRAEVQRKVGGVDPSRYGLERAWTALMLDLKQRIARGAIYLVGVQVEPEERLEPERIPSVWATDYSINPANSTIAGRHRRWLTVRASDSPFDDVADSVSPAKAVEQAPMANTQREVAASPTPKREAITEANVYELTDEEVLVLLEDHARRVVGTPDAKLITPGKISLLPIIRRKMLHRHAVGEARETLGAEADALAKWIATKVPSHQAPTASTIEKGLRRDYKRPIRRSKPEIGQ
jgi:hypothetical protein